MKFRITIKDPDGISEGIQTAAISKAKSDAPNATAYVKAAIAQATHEELTEFVHGWLEYGDYAYIEFDTEAKTARLLTAKEAEVRP